MRKRDRIFIAPLLAVSLLFAAAPTALAAESGEQFVFDKADLLTTEEEDELNDMNDSVSYTNRLLNFILVLLILSLLVVLGIVVYWILLQKGII